MAHNSVQRLAPENSADGAGAEPLAPEMDFARRLYHYMGEKGWTNSDLARAVWGEKRNAAGHTEAKGRDRISVYLKGQTMPEARTLKLLADALGVTPEDLCPATTQRALAWEPKSVSMTVAPGHPDKAHLTVDRVLPFTLAARIVALLAEHDEKGAEEAHRA